MGSGGAYMHIKELRTDLTWKMVSDPLYGYVYFNTEIEEPIINSIILQRLRYIMQLQTAHYVYPGAVHTRFQHSLGVMHLAGLMTEDLLYKVVSIYGKEALEGYEPATIVEASRISGLLHDVGHAAFGHAFEYALLWRKNLPRELSNHEKIGYLLVKNIIEDQLEKVDKNLSGFKELVYTLLGDSEPRGIASLLKWIIKDGYYPADILDFLRRDSYYAGTSEYGSIMYERLYKNSYPILLGDKFEIVIDRVALGEFKQYMRAKASMYEHVYYHSVCRSFDRILYDIIYYLDPEIGLTDRVLRIKHGDVEGYLELTDAFFYAIMMSKALRDKTRVGELCRRLIVERKPEWRRIGRDVSLSVYKGLDALKTALKLVLDSEYRKKVIESVHEVIIEDLKKHNLSGEDLWLDVLDITPLPRSTIYPSSEQMNPPLVLRVGKRSGRKITISEELDIVSEELPIEVIFRLYVARNKYSVDLELPATQALLNAINTVLGIDVLTVSKAVKDIYTSYTGRDYYKVKLTM